MNPTPAITVLMPVHNARAFLPESVPSILNQTFRDFEFLIMDDGSTDGSGEFLRALPDKRLRIVRHDENLGIVKVLNAGLELAKGGYIARMDADDIALPERLAAQWRFLEDHPEVGLLGSTIEVFGELQSQGWVRYLRHRELLVALLFENPFCHSSVLMRAATLRRTRLRYPASYPHAEEYAFWLRLASQAQLANLPQSLLKYRSHRGQISNQKSGEQCRSVERILTEQLEALGLVVARSELAIHQMLGTAFNPVPAYPRKLRDWAARILHANARCGVLPQEELARQLQARTAAAIERTHSLLEGMTLLRRLRWLASAGMRHYRARA